MHRTIGRDIVAGALFVLIGLAGLIGGAEYRVGTALDMGPGYIPRLLCWLMITLGFLIGAKGFVSGNQPIPRIHLRPLGFVVGSLFVFAVLLKPAGLLLASAASVVVASLAAQDRQLIHAVFLAAGLAAAAALIFVVALRLPFPLVPT